MSGRAEAIRNLQMFANILVAATVLYTIGYICKNEPLRVNVKPAKPVKPASVTSPANRKGRP